MCQGLVMKYLAHSHAEMYDIFRSLICYTKEIWITPNKFPKELRLPCALHMKFVGMYYGNSNSPRVGLLYVVQYVQT